MTDKVDKAMFCALETCILIIGGVLTGCMSVILMAFVMEIPMPGKVLSFCLVVGRTLKVPPKRTLI